MLQILEMYLFPLYFVFNLSIFIYVHLDILTYIIILSNLEYQSIGINIEPFVKFIQKSILLLTSIVYLQVVNHIIKELTITFEQWLLIDILFVVYKNIFVISYKIIKYLSEI